MAQPARPLSPVPEPATRLRVADEPRHIPRPKPSPQVIRRRRAVALGGLAGLIGLPLALVAIGGSTPSEVARVTALLSAGSTAPQTLCDHLSSPLLAVVGGHDACVASSPERGPSADVHDVRITGSTATAVVTSSDGDEHFHLVKRDGDWKVDDVR